MKPSISQQLSAFHEAKSMTLPLIALRDVITYPKTHTAVFMARETSLEVVNRTYESSQPLVAFVPQRNSDIEAPEPKDLYDLGVIGVVSQVIELPDGTRKVLVEGLERARIRDVKFETTSFTCTAEVFEPEKDDFLGPVFDELVAKVEAAYSHAASQNGARNAAPLHEPSVPVSVSDREAILYAMLSQTTIPLQRQMELLSRESLTERYEFFYEALRVNDELRDLESRIQMRVKQQIEGNQRDYFINEQIKALRRELNRDEEDQRESDEYLKKLDEEGKDFPEVVRERIQNEAKKLDQMPPSSSESAVVRSYLDTLFEVPWTKRTEISTDLKKAREVLDADHWGLEKVKERILEYLAVQRRVNMTKAPILCFVGAPGVGKTSLGRSIARATGREYVRMALGGVRDEAEIRGHRRTYVGAMPGRVIKSPLKAKVRNPLFLLDGNIIAGHSASGSASFQMYLYAVPSAAGDREFSEEARCTLKVYRNSELIDVKDYITIESFYGLIADEYAVSPGDEVTVTAESDGFLTASASTVIPGNPPAVEIACSRDGDNLDVRFSFGDNAGTDDAYAFSFRTLASDGKPGDNDPGNLVELPYGDLGSPVIDNGPFDVVWEDGYSYYCIQDDSFNGGRKEIELTFTSFPFSSDMTSYFRIEVRHVSPERILYETAVADKASNILGFVGLAPVTFAYTNVSGGSGCFSGVNTAYTDWVEIPD